MQTAERKAFPDGVPGMSARLLREIGAVGGSRFFARHVTGRGAGDRSSLVDLAESFSDHILQV
jgi:hypothetical protein